MSVAWLVYRGVAPAVGALAPFAGVLAGPERASWNERLGRVPAPARPAAAWIHAASLGEAVAVGPLVRELIGRAPGAPLFLTATTRTGRERLRGLEQPAALGARDRTAALAPLDVTVALAPLDVTVALAPLDVTVALAPLDAPQPARTFFERVRPQRVLLLETELWPHWLLRARARGVPVASVSARLSERSVRRYASLGGTFRGLVAGLAAVLCQTDADAKRWRALGARPERTRVVGNLKHDALPVADGDRAAARARLGLDPARPLLALGSLRPGEAEIAAAAWRSLPAALRREWQVVAVPRHAGAATGLEREAARAGVGRAGDAAPDADAWRWDARPGVLRDVYAAADVAVVGGSLAPFGGHNPLEPAACGCAVVMGAQHGSQREALGWLERADAVTIVGDAAELARALQELLGDAERRGAAAAHALAAAAAARGAAARAVHALVELGVWPPA